MQKLTRLVISTLLIAGAIQPLMAQRGRSSDNRSAGFGDDERRIITEYYRVNTSNLPPGLAKRNGKLPPGLEKQLERNGQLPPGLQKRVSSFPPDLEARLPRLPEPLVRAVIGVQAVIYNKRTNVIVDVMAILGGR